MNTAPQKLPVTPALATKLAKLGLVYTEDLLVHFPLRHENHTQLTSWAALHPGLTAQIDGCVTSSEVQFRPRRQLVVMLRDLHSDDPQPLILRFLNFYPNQQKLLAVGAQVRVRGEVRDGYFGLEMVHPECAGLTAQTRLPEHLTPIYPTTAGVGQKTLIRLITPVLSRDWPDTLPSAVRDALQLMPFAEAVRVLHSPPIDVDEYSLLARTHPAWLRIKFDELLAQQMSLHRARAQRAERRAPRLPSGVASLAQRLLNVLPFQLTTAQQRVWHEIAHDLNQPHPMSRLLQGDVGCGKTIVAALAACQALDAGYQVALMAPTEILAEQHARKLADWLTPLGVHLCWLAGQLSAKEKKRIHQQIAQHEVQLLIGTHALIQEQVQFAKLGLAIVDEQHRFGVAQRLSLRSSTHLAKAQDGASTSEAIPHQLMMSATPIPRTLAMTYYADLDVSVIDELPPGRTPIKTKLVDAARRAEVLQRVRNIISTGRQVYWVCPLIEESETLQLQTAQDTYQQLIANLPDLHIRLLHGRLPASEKADIMAAFVRNELQMLVATTVIEVGVDVPNASLMVIENAERFGLAQLHQLRGRVGRGTAESTCVLLYQKPLSQTARARLQAMYETNDGFEIARRDLQIRGPGEFLGARQSGQALLRYADLQQDTALVELARQTAQKMLVEYPQHCEQHLQRWLAGREEFLKA